MIECRFQGTIQSLPRLLVSGHPSEKQLTLEDDVRYIAYHNDKLFDLFIPKGFTFSADIPRAAWSITYGPTDPKVWWSALVHDFGYVNHLFTQKTLDIAYKDISDVCVPEVQEGLMYKALRLFGWTKYNKRK